MQCLFKLSKCLLYIIVKCDRLTFICDKKNGITQNRMRLIILIWKYALYYFFDVFWSFFLCDLLIF